MKIFRILVLLQFVASGILAKGKNVVDNQQLLIQYLQQQTFDIDTAAQAVILYEKGTVFNVAGELSYKVERTIKVLSTEAIQELATLHISHDQNSRISAVSATTYNFENNQMTEQAVNESNILEDKLNKSITVTKFNLPSVKKGSVIHYTYFIEQPGVIFLPAWGFQGKYPKLYSEYETNLPLHVIYHATERMKVPLARVKKETELDNCEGCFYDNIFNETQARIWVKRNIPAFKEEAYMSSADNYLERVELQAVARRSGGATIEFYKSWKDITQYMVKNQDFCGQVFNKNNFLADKAAELTGDKTTELEKTKAIYRYVRDNFETATGPGNATDNIEKIFGNKKGSPVGVNLLLAAMLRKAGIESAPLLLSTRENERMSKDHLNPLAANYVACVATIDKQHYFMDASEREIPFGILPPNCYNGFCVIVDGKGKDAVLDPDSLVDKSSVVVSLKPSEKEKGKLLLKVTQQFGALSGIGYRKEWHRDSLLARKEITARLKKNAIHTEIQQVNIRNMDRPDDKLIVEYEAIADLPGSDVIYFDAYFLKLFDKNPYTATTRKYSVERDYREDISYVFNFQLPPGYIMDDYPKSAIYNFGDPGLITMKNMARYDEGEHTFSMNSRFTTTTTFFAAEEYEDLRKFYEQALTEQQKRIVIKKSDN